MNWLCLRTTAAAAVLGMGLVLVIHPGDPAARPSKFGSGGNTSPSTLKGSSLDAVMDMIRNCFPNNLVQAAFQQVRTHFEEAVDENSNSTEANGTESVVYIRKGLEYTNGPNVLGLITFSLCFGVCMTKMRETAKPIIVLINACDEVILKLMMFFMWYTPVGIFFLIVSNILTIEDLAATGRVMGMFIVTVISALLVHLFVNLVGLYFIVTRKNPLVFLKNMLPAMMTAFGTASSSVTLPFTFFCLEEKNGVDPRVTRFMLPIGATINMDGTALYEAVCAIFIAQLNNISLSVGDIVTICLTSIAASVGAATIPSAGLVTMILVFTAVGLPTEQISLIYTIDWFLDRCRTTVNVLGDSYGTAIVHKLSVKDLEKSPLEEEEAFDFTQMAQQPKLELSDTELLRRASNPRPNDEESV